MVLNPAKPSITKSEANKKAYRFSVPEGSTSGVSHANYTYQDAVEVPFEVWNISADPPEQITVSFRDNKNDGSFNIITEYGESREYIFPQNLPYDPTMSQDEIKQEIEAKAFFLE